jgi:hypothetical protein
VAAFYAGHWLASRHSRFTLTDVLVSVAAGRDNLSFYNRCCAIMQRWEGICGGGGRSAARPRIRERADIGNACESNCCMLHVSVQSRLLHLLCFGTGFIWLRFRTRGGLLCTRLWTCGFCKATRIFWLAEELTVSRKTSSQWVVTLFYSDGSLRLL